MFAPPEAAKLLELPSDRQVWTRVYELLNKMHLKELIIERLNDVCPGPCRVSARNRRTAVQNIGETRWEFDDDWVVKALMQSILHMLPTMTIKFLVDGSLLCRKRIEIVSGRSWNLLDNQVSFYHRCNVLTFEGRPSGFLGPGEDGHDTYKVPMRLHHSSWPQYNILDREDDAGMLEMVLLEE